MYSKCTDCRINNKTIYVCKLQGNPMIIYTKGAVIVW